MRDEITTHAGSHLGAKSGFFGVAGESRLRPRIVSPGTNTRIYLRSNDDGRVTEVIVFNPVLTKLVTQTNPETGITTPIAPVVVFTIGPAGETQVWGCRDERPDELTFFPHPEYVHTRVCPDCKGEKVTGVDPVTNPMGSKCVPCEESGAVSHQVRVVMHPDVKAEQIYLEPVRSFSFPDHHN